MMLKLFGRLLLASACCVLLTHCAGSSKTTSKSRYQQAIDGHPKTGSIPNIYAIKNAVPKPEPKSRRGNPAKYTVNNKSYYPLKSAKNYSATGMASWYGTKFHGHETSNGERYDMFAMTAAHKTLPIPTYVKVVNLQNKRHVIVKVNDRGPFHDDRIIDLSYAAAAKLDIVKTGTAKVRVSAIDMSRRAKRGKRSKRSNLQPAKQPGGQTPPQQYLQLGAFKQPQNAKKFAKQMETKLATLSQQLSLKININQQDNFYKVKIGPIKTPAMLAQVKNAIE